MKSLQSLFYQPTVNPMPFAYLFSIFLVCLQMLSSPVCAATAQPIIIADKGGGNGPFEHTLVGSALAVERGAGFLQIQVLLSADNIPIAFSDLTLNRLTDVARLFPDRHRKDGGFYVADFSLIELRQLRLQPAFESGPDAPLLPLVTLEEILNLIRHLDTQSGHSTGFVVELRFPTFHQKEQKEQAKVVLDLLQNYPDLLAGGRLYLASIDSDQLQQLHDSLLPQRSLALPLIQLFEANKRDGATPATGSNWLLTNSGLRLVASYATTLCLPIEMLEQNSAQGVPPAYLAEIRKYGLQLFISGVKTKPTGQDQQGSAANLQALLTRLSPEGIFTEDYSKVAQLIQQLTPQEKKTTLPPFFSDLNLSPLRHQIPSENQPQTLKN